MKSDYLKRDEEGRAQQFIVFRDNIGQFLVSLRIPATDPELTTLEEQRLPCSLDDARKRVVGVRGVT